MDLAPGARALLEISLNTQEGESVMIVTEPATLSLGPAFLEAAKGLGAEAFLTVVDVPTSGAEPPEAVALAMKEADVVVLATQKSLSHTKARRLANRGGSRIISIPGITEGMLAEGCLTADHQEVEGRMVTTYQKIRKAESLRATTPQGTDLSVAITEREWITDDTGLCRGRGDFSTFPAGELLVAPVEGSADGTLVADVFFHQFLRQPAEATIREGYAVGLSRAVEAERAMDVGGHEGRHLSRFGLGFNPAARWTKNPLEAVKALGALHVGFGDNTVLGGEIACGVSVEAVVRGVSLEADGKPVLEHGQPV